MKNAIFCSIALTLALSGTALAQKGEVMEPPKATEKNPAPPPAPSTPPKSPAPPKAPESADKSGTKPESSDKTGGKTAPATEGATCTLLTKEAPRGGRLEVEGSKLGKSPVVKIGGAVTRIIESPGNKIAVQIPAKSDGGAVVVRVDGKDVACGSLTIIGLD